MVPLLAFQIRALAGFISSLAAEPDISTPNREHQTPTPDTISRQFPTKFHNLNVSFIRLSTDRFQEDRRT
jgi:hypothetical protein